MSHVVTNSFINELTTKIHDLSGDSFSLALYGPQSGLSRNTTVYTTTGEVTGTNYTAGGLALTNNGLSSGSDVTYLDFADLVFSTLTVSDIQYGLIYNTTAGNRSVLVLDFTILQSPIAQNFTIQFPGATATTATLRFKQNG